MQRKLVKQGAATLMVSLPSKWCKAHGLGKGSEVDIEEDGPGLQVSATARDATREAIVEIGGLTESATRTAIVNAYRAGYDRITVRWGSGDQAPLIERIANQYLLGFDIASRGSGTCVLESITEPAKERVDAIVRKLILATRFLTDETLTRLETGRTFAYADATLKIHRYDNFCRRVLSTHGSLGAHESFLWTFLTLVVHGQRELYHLNRALDRKAAKGGKTPLAAPLREAIALLERGYVANDMKPLETLHDIEKRAIYDVGYKALNARGDPVVTYHLLSALRQFYLAASPLTGIVLQSSDARGRAPTSDRSPN